MRQKDIGRIDPLNKKPLINKTVSGEKVTVPLTGLVRV